MERQEQKLQVQSNWLLFFLFLLFIYRNDTKKLGFQEISLVDLDKKSKLLNRIKGYMNPQEQHIVHSAEIILQIISNVKVLVDQPKIATSDVTYSSLNLEDRKRNMLMDLSEFLEEEKKMLIHQAVDFDIKIKALEKKLNELHKLSQKGDHIANIHDYIEVFEPILADEIKEKVFEFKKLASMLKAINSLKSKEKIDELDIVEIIQPFVNKEQKDSLVRMVQIFKAINSVKDEGRKPTNDDAKQLFANIEKSEDKEVKEDMRIKKNIKTETNNEKDPI